MVRTKGLMIPNGRNSQKESPGLRDTNAIPGSFLVIHQTKTSVCAMRDTAPGTAATAAQRVMQTCAPQIPRNCENFCCRSLRKGGKMVPKEKCPSKQELQHRLWGPTLAGSHLRVLRALKGPGASARSGLPFQLGTQHLWLTCT